MRASSSLSRAVLFIAAAAAASALNNGVGRVPALGYSTWNRWLLGINETLVIELADALVSTGLRAAGYEYLNLDAGVWLHARDAAGNLQADPAKFPSGLPALAAAVRARGLRLGLYTDLGEGSCGPGPGSGGHWPQDARYFASLGADYIKRVSQPAQ
jgi:alpha-galactosidase